MLYSRPGSLTVYTTAPRQDIPPPSDCPKTVAPNSYHVKNYAINALQETLAPFDTTEELSHFNSNGIPGPDTYNPDKLRRNARGSPAMRWGDRFPPTKYETAGAGPGISTGDPWERMEEKIYHECNTMRPRINFPKYVSNNVPSVFHPLDIRSFIKGGDHRMYPWRKPKRIPKIPGPIYNTFKIYTSQSHVAPVVDFTNTAERGTVFKPRPGAGPAEYHTGLPLNPNGGIFLSKSDDPSRSALRLMELVIQQARKPHPGPGDHCIRAALDKPSPKACSAPFKSKVPLLGFPEKRFGPSPQEYFRTDMTIPDLEYPLWPYPKVRVPPHPPFQNSAPRFQDPTTREVSLRPSPNQYHIRSFTDTMCLELYKHAAAICNPKLGFLTSAEARESESRAYRLDALRGVCDCETIPGKWRNIRPKKCQTYPYHEYIWKTGDSPGPIYETASAMKAIKGKRDWFAPRGCSWTGFNNSGCGRKTMETPDPEIPGPEYYIPSFIPGPGGGIKRTGKRTEYDISPGPGPTHVLHEKCDSMWRATQLGTFNTHLKGLGTLRPSAGGFHPHGPIDDLADMESGYIRLEDCPEAYMHQSQTGNVT